MAVQLQSPLQGLTRALSFGRKPRAPPPILADDDDGGETTPRLVTPRTAQELHIELERESKDEPLGLKFAVLPEYYMPGVVVPEGAVVVITEVASKGAAAGLKPGDCVICVGSRAVSSVQDCEESLKCIAGCVFLQVWRSKKLPAGWAITEDGDRAVLTLREFSPAVVSAPQVELTVEHVHAGAPRGVLLCVNSKGQVVIHTVTRQSAYYKHVRVGDKLSQINGIDVGTNPMGAGYALTAASGRLTIYGTFVPPTPECAATECPCCTAVFGHRCPPPKIAPKPVEPEPVAEATPRPRLSVAAPSSIVTPRAGLDTEERQDRLSVAAEREAPPSERRRGLSPERVVRGATSPERARATPMSPDTAEAMRRLSVAAPSSIVTPRAGLDTEERQDRLSVAAEREAPPSSRRLSLPSRSRLMSNVPGEALRSVDAAEANADAAEVGVSVEVEMEVEVDLSATEQGTPTGRSAKKAAELGTPTARERTPTGARAVDSGGRVPSSRTPPSRKLTLPSRLAAIEADAHRDAAMMADAHQFL